MGVGPRQALEVSALCRLSGVRIVITSSEHQEGHSLQAGEKMQSSDPLQGCILNPTITGSLYLLYLGASRAEAWPGLRTPATGPQHCVAASPTLPPPHPLSLPSTPPHPTSLILSSPCLLFSCLYLFSLVPSLFPLFLSFLVSFSHSLLLW